MLCEMCSLPGWRTPEFQPMRPLPPSNAPPPSAAPAPSADPRSRFLDASSTLRDGARGVQERKRAFNNESTLPSRSSSWERLRKRRGQLLIDLNVVATSEIDD
eukprot:1343117-Prymnesium_polylepis.2